MTFIRMTVIGVRRMEGYMGCTIGREEHIALVGIYLEGG